MSRPDREPFSKDDAELALAVMLEPLAAGGRVLWAGEPGPGAERLLACAASVEALAGPRRTRLAGRRGSGVKTRGLPAAGERWDLVVLPELEDVARLGEAAQWIATDGSLVASSSAGPLGYERLEAELGRVFGEGGARILGQTRFAGFALVDFARADGSELSFDGTALEEVEPAQRWIAIAGAAVGSPSLAAYLVVQTAAGDGSATPERGTVERASVERAPAERTGAERELEAARARLEHAEKRLEQAQREIARSAQKLDELRHQLDEANASRTGSAAALEESRRQLRAATERAASAEKNAFGAAEVREIEASYVELEERLRAQGGELAALRAELERRAILVRDLVEELAEARRSPAPAAVKPASGATLPELDRLKAQVAGLLRRVADAEGQRAAAHFAADELRGRLERSEAERQRLDTERQRLAAERHQLELERTQLRSELASRPAAEVVRGPEAAALASEREALARQSAMIEGRLRGLTARLAEVDELRRLAEARVLLLEVDLGAARETARARLADFEQAREQLAVARMAPPPGDPRREGTLLGTLSRTRESLLAAEEERDRLVKELGRARAGLVAAEQEAAGARGGSAHDVAVLRSELEVLRASEANARAALVELRAAHEARLVALDALEGERNGLSLRLGDAEAALASSSDRLAVLAGERDGLAARLEGSRAALRQLAEGSASSPVGEFAADLEWLVAERSEARRIGLLLAEAERDLEVIRREREAEAARAADAERMLADERGEAGKLGRILGEVERDIERIRREREAAVEAAAAAQEDARQRTAGAIARLQARDALVARLHTELASSALRRDALREEIARLEERLRRDAEQRAAEAAVGEVQEAEDARERSSLVGAADAAQRERDHARAQRDGLRGLLSEARGSLGRLVDGLRAPDPRGAAFAAESILRDELAALRRELDDRSLLVRALGAQVEERDARLRTLEAGSAGEAQRALTAALEAAEERQARLARELELAAERRTAAMEREADLRRLETELAGREEQLMDLEGRLAQSQRVEAGLRESLEKLGGELEGVLSRAGSEAPAATLERIAQALRSLRR